MSNNTVAILSNLLETIQGCDASNIKNDRDKAIAGAFIAELGLRCLTLNSLNSDLAHSCQGFIAASTQDNSAYKWQRYKREANIDGLQSLFTDSQIVSTADWSDIYGASDLWDGLRLDVIKPLRKKDFEFIFYLGDPTKRSVQEVDEILDIISDFSNYGRVTFVLNEEEACKLWMILRLPRTEQRYLSIFNTMKIDHLLVLGVDRTLFFSKEEQFELVGKSHNYAKIKMEVRNNFDAGYSLGLQLQLKISGCVALGLAAAGSYMENGISPDQNAVISYIQKWMAEFH